MIFALEYLNRMERTYPGVLAQMQRMKSTTDAYVLMARKGVPQEKFNLMTSLAEWRKYKAFYNFEKQIATEVMEFTERPDNKIPMSYMRRLPYPCIAVHTCPIEIKDHRSDRVLITFSGNAFIWIEDDGRLHSTWEIDDEVFEWTFLDVDEVSTFNDWFDHAMETLLQFNDISDGEIAEMKEIFGVKKFQELNAIGGDQGERLIERFGVDKARTIVDAINKSNIQEVLLQRVISIVLYLNCTNADIEAAEEKLKAGAWASIIGGEPREVRRNERRQALRETEGVKVMDVGYRIASDFKRSFSGDEERSEGSGEKTGRTVRYHTRRRHAHHYWVGPRNGPIAEDIMHPGEGERGLVLYWHEVIEVNKHKKTDEAFEVGVKRQEEPKGEYES